MNTKSLAILATLLLALAASTLTSAAAAPAPAVTMQATMHGSNLNLRGDSFTPGSTVAVAAIDARSWRIVSRARVHSEPATYPCPTGASVFCGQRNPAAGQLDARMTVHARSHSQLRVLYRSGSTVGLITIDRR